MADIPLTISHLASPDGTTPDALGNSDATAKTQQGDKDQAQADVEEVNNDYTRMRSDRRPLEAQWFFNASLIRGLSNTRWNPVLNMLEQRRGPSHKSTDTINIVLPKVKAKLSKFLKSRALPVVQPASTDHEDIMNAKATTKVLEYLWERLQLEEKYEEALLWAMQTGKSFWWFYWNEKAVAAVRDQPDIMGKQPIYDVPLGDVGVDLGTAFEMLVDDPGITKVQNQKKIIRAKTRLVKDVEAQFKLQPGDLEGEVKEGDLFQYQRQIAQLGAKASTGMASLRSGQDKDDKSTYIVVKEHFTAPNDQYPKGCYKVVAGTKLLNKIEELPHGLADRVNPFPVVEFSDNLTAGQFWPTTMVEQLTGIQLQYTRVRRGLDENLKLHQHPKIFVPMQAKVHKNAWTSASGEKIPINWQPGMPPPNQWVVTPPNIASDTWRAIDLLRTESDLVTNLYPASIGGQGATSGFDTSLLQEAADSVHAPDIRRNELALRDGAYIMRRIIKLGYDVQRLIAIVGRDKAPDVFEFSQEQVDEHANIIIDTGSSLPLQKHARIEAILKLDERQAFGPPGDPTRNRKLLKLLDLGSQEEDAAMVGRSEEHARLENLSFTRGEPVEDPMPWENHDVEYEVHTDLLQSPEIKSWTPDKRTALVRHTILHVKWKNPQNAMQLAAVFGMQDVIQEIQQTMALQQSVAQPPAPGPSQPGGPPQGASPAVPQQGPPAQAGGQPAPQAAA
jgi:hypothetical protein